jgi:predicted transposase/invertase (TIGR01784 family)
MTFEMLMEEKFEAGMEKGRVEGIAQGIEKGREEGIEQGAYNNKLETAKKLLLKGMSPAEISEITGLQIEKIMELKNMA